VGAGQETETETDAESVGETLVWSLLVCIIVSNATNLSVARRLPFSLHN